jgi:hypothetical protein
MSDQKSSGPGTLGEQLAEIVGGTMGSTGVESLIDTVITGGDSGKSSSGDGGNKK